MTRLRDAACLIRFLGAPTKTDKPGTTYARALGQARAHGVRAEAVERRAFPDAASFERRLLELLDEEHIDVVVLAGFLQILSGAFVARYAGRIVNVHPSLIPSFCGRGLCTLPTMISGV